MELSQALENRITFSPEMNMCLEIREIAKTISDFLRTLPKEQCEYLMGGIGILIPLPLFPINLIYQAKAKLNPCYFVLKQAKNYLKKEGISRERKGFYWTLLIN